mmetsp:Transcript_6477/g.16079  ORF Transcript_6477/g.16079 Transcript_6477/m.16079 type:complete len:244 (-) Transcript_6477:1980-2711(-)
MNARLALINLAKSESFTTTSSSSSPFFTLRLLCPFPSLYCTPSTTSTTREGEPIQGGDAHSSSITSSLPSLSLPSSSSSLTFMPVCVTISSLYLPPSTLKSCSCDPLSSTLPASITKMMSACRIVDRRWAMIMEVLPASTVLSAPCTAFSLSVSNALVASSSSMIEGFFIAARAMAILCFCPPDSCTPLSPARVSSPFGRAFTNAAAFAILSAFQIKSSLAPSLARRMLLRRLVGNMIGSCPT